MNKYEKKNVASCFRCIIYLAWTDTSAPYHTLVCTPHFGHRPNCCTGSANIRLPQPITADLINFFFNRNREHLTLMRYFSVTLLPFNSFSLSEVSGITPGPTITKQAARQIYFYYKDDVLTFLEFFRFFFAET